MKNPKDNETVPGVDNAKPELTPEKTAQIKSEPKPVRVPKRWRVIIIGLLILLLFNIAGAGVGYASGIQVRLVQEKQQSLVTAATHFNYGVQAMLQGNYEIAQVQFEYVLKIDPDFPQLREKYTQTMVELAKKNLPTPTPQATPTPDNSGVEAKFQQAQQAVNAKNWPAAMQALEALRNQDVKYKALEVDGLYYIALRFDAIQKIMKEGDLEGGLYYFTLANRFAPLDHEALNYAEWARDYITAVSFWKVDWEKVVYYMAMVYQASPSIHDINGRSARDRQIEALWRLGDDKMSIKAPCEALNYYQTSLSIQNDSNVQAKLTAANNACYPTSAPTSAVTQQATSEPVPVVTQTATSEPVPSAAPTTSNP